MRTEERIDILGVAGIIKHEGGQRASNSTGTFDTLNGGPKIFSRYRSPSFSSCHDFCKYGEERALEIKARGPISTNKRNLETLGDGQDPEKNVSSLERKKNLAASGKQSHASESQKLDNPTVKRDVSSSSFKEIDVLVRHSSDPKMNLKLSKRTSLPLLRYSKGEVDRKFRKIKDTDIFNIDACFVKRVSLNKTDDVYRHASDTKRKPTLPKLSKQFFLPIQISSNGGTVRKARISKDTKILKRDDAIVHQAVSSLTEETKKLDDAADDGVVSSLTKDDPMKPNDAVVDGVVSSLTKEETTLTGLVSSSLKEIDVPVRHTSDPKRKSNLSKQSSLPVRRFSSGGGDRNTLKEIDVPVKHTRDPKGKSNLLKQSSLPVQRLSSVGEGNIIKSKDMNLPRTSARISSVRTKSKSTRSKAMRSSTRGERKLVETSIDSLSANHPLRRASSWNRKNFKQLNQVSHSSNRKTVRKHENKKYSSDDVTKKTLDLAEQNVVEKTPSPIKNDIPATDLSPPSSSSPNDKILESVQNGIHSAKLAPLSANWNFRHSQERNHAPRSRRSWPSSPGKRGSRSTRLRTHTARSDTSSLGSLSTDGETDIENQISDLDKELESRRGKDGTVSLKDESNPGQKLAFRRGKVVDLQPEDSTPRTLKFKQRVLGDGQNGTNDDDAAKLFPFLATRNVRRTRKRMYARSTQERINARRTMNKMYDTQSLPSRPPSPKEKALLGTPYETCASSELGETDTENQISDLEKELMNRFKKSKTIRLKDEHSPGEMLSFECARSVDLQPEDSTPRRLKFKQTVIRENQDGEDDADGGEVSVTKTESEKVALRRQDVTKGTIGRSNLYNNVIEETVSELVKTSKSKVKALVGAFENLISLQDTKPL